MGSDALPETKIAEGPRRISSWLHRAAVWTAGHQALVVVPLGMALVAAAGWYQLGAKSLWLDETFSMAIARLDWAGAWNSAWGTTDGGNQLLYHGLAHLWLGLGPSEGTFRSQSLLIAIATVPPFYALADRTFGPFAAACSVLLLSLNAFFIAYAQEARGYTLLVFMVVVSSLLLLRALDKPTSGRWIAYAVSACLAMYVHYFAVFVLAAHAVSLLAQRPRVPWRGLVAVYGSIAMTALPLAVGAARGTALTWVPNPTLAEVEFTLRTLIGSTGSRLLPLAYVLVCGLGLVAALTGRRWRWEWLLATSLAALPIGLALAVSLVKPIFVARYLIVALPGLILLTGAGLSVLRPRWLALTSLGVLLTLTVSNLPGMYGTPKEDWRDAVAYVNSHAQPGDATIAYPSFSESAVDYYTWRQPAQVPIQRLFPASDGATLQQVAQKANPTYKRLWIVYRYGPPAASSADGQAIATLTNHHAPIDEMNFPYVLVDLYQAP